MGGCTRFFENTLWRFASIVKPLITHAHACHPPARCGCGSACGTRRRGVGLGSRAVQGNWCVGPCDIAASSMFSITHSFVPCPVCMFAAAPYAGLCLGFVKAAYADAGVSQSYLDQGSAKDGCDIAKTKAGWSTGGTPPLGPCAPV